jgi:putative nucleotidyltransferase with HDIG domain
LRQLFYRIGQFRRARRDSPSGEGLALAREILSPDLFALFSRMMPFEQAHAVRVMEKLAEAGHQDADLMTVALLHDVGKVEHPLRPLERGLGVLVKNFLPEIYRKLGAGEPGGLRTGIVVAVQHANWGADLAAQAGANQRVVWLIRHHDADLGQLSGVDLSLLRELQRVDSVS